MNLVYQSAFLKALGWSLVDSLWQMGILWLLYTLLIAGRKRFSSKHRHSLALLSITGGSVWFIINLTIQLFKAGNPETSATNSFAGQLSEVTPYFDNSLPFLSILYLLVISYLFCRLLVQYRQTSRLYRTNLKKADPELRVFVRDIAEQMGIRKEVRLWLSDLVDTPLTIGFWKPIILLPVATVNQLSLKQAEAIILHELNHIYRNDYMINLLISFSEVVMFFNPFARLLADAVRREREHSCDDFVLQFGYKPKEYANALLILEKNRSIQPVLAIAATGKGKRLLFNRVKRILTNETVSSPFSHKMFGFLLSFCVIGFIGWYNPATIIIEKQNEARIDDVTTGRTEYPTFIENPVNVRQSLPEKGFVATVNLQHDQAEVSADLVEDESSLSNLLEQITEDQMALSANEEATAALAKYVQGTANLREYSIAENVPSRSPVEGQSHPYIPSQSFAFQTVEDTALPKRKLLTYHDIQAKDALDKTLKGLQEIDWLKLEKELNAAGKKVDIIILQEEIRKAVAEVDWKKINAEVEGSLHLAQEELLQGQEQLRIQLEKHQKNRLLKQEQQRKMKEMILEDRLHNTESNVPDAKPVTPAAPKKVIHI